MTQTQTIERRVFTVEMRVQRRDDAGPLLVGHAAVFNQLSEDLGGFREKIAPGAFKTSIGEDDIRALFNHDPSLILGRNVAGTLRLKEDRVGLAYELDLPDTQLARDLAVSIERGDITGNSFGFQTVSDKWEMKDGVDLRTLLEARLFDISPVTYPAYPQTDLAMRSLEAWRASQAAPVSLVDPRDTRLDILAPTLRARG